MAEPEPHPPRNGNGRHGSVMVTISERLIRVLPPAFIALLVINVMFIGVIAWVFDHNAEARNVLLTKIIERCLLTPRDHADAAPPGAGLQPP
jgi:hypothetical protein